MARRSPAVVGATLAAALLLPLLSLLPRAAAAGGILPPRALAPSFSAKAAVGGEIQTISLEKDLLKGKDGWAVLLFYPLDFTFVCPVRSFGNTKGEWRVALAPPLQTPAPPETRSRSRVPSLSTPHNQHLKKPRRR